MVKLKGPQDPASPPSHVLFGEDYVRTAVALPRYIRMGAAIEKIGSLDKYPHGPTVDIRDPLDNVRGFLKLRHDFRKKPSRADAVGYLIKRGLEIVENSASPISPVDMPVDEITDKTLTVAVHVDQTSWDAVYGGARRDKITVPERILVLIESVLSLEYDEYGEIVRREEERQAASQARPEKMNKERKDQ